MKTKEKILELENRKKLYEFISRYPGVHQRQIIREIELSEGTIKYHLNFLIKKGFIDKKTTMGYTRFYPSKKIGMFEKKLLGIFRQETPRQILILLITNFGVSLVDLSKELKKDKKSIIYHLKKLIESDLIEPAEFKDGMMLTNRYETVGVVRKPVGREKIYRLKKPYLIYHFFVKYKDSFLDDEITKNAIDYIDFIGEGVQPKKYDGKKVNNKIVKVIYDIFPHPYHV